MIEIIRQEDADGSNTPRELPKDIKQIGSPDIGDRIYVEDGAYQALHPYDSLEEKRAYVLLGKFENCSGRQCVFAEAVIPLPEMSFDGELPLWNDHTWAYIYKHLKREYDSMVIVGWAMDIKGQLPNMTVRLEQLHLNHFGGAHQLLLLMDSLEREEAFYSNRNGHLYRREGFYIYYDRERAKARRGAEKTKESAQAGDERPGYAGNIQVNSGAREEQTVEKNEGVTRSSGMSFEERMRMDEPEGREKQASSGRWIGEKESSEEKERERRGAGEGGEEPAWSRFFRENGVGTGTELRGKYRKQVMEEEEAKRTPSYASTFLLAMVVCALGVTAYLNHEKMSAMEETLAQMRQTQTISTEDAADQTKGTELANMPEVEVENVAGNVKKQEEVAAGSDGAGDSTDAEATGADEANALDNTADAEGSVSTTGSVVTTSGSAEGSSTEGGSTTTSSTENGSTTSGSADAAGSTAADGASETATAAVADNTTETAATTEAQTYLNQGYYVVQKGDSLVGICRKIYQTTAMMEKLCEVNGIEDEDSIYAGQYLTLPN